MAGAQSTREIDSGGSLLSLGRISVTQLNQEANQVKKKIFFLDRKTYLDEIALETPLAIKFVVFSLY